MNISTKNDWFLRNEFSENVATKVTSNDLTRRSYLKNAFKILNILTIGRTLRQSPNVQRPPFGSPRDYIYNPLKILNPRKIWKDPNPLRAVPYDRSLPNLTDHLTKPKCGVSAHYLNLVAKGGKQWRTRGIVQCFRNTSAWTYLTHVRRFGDRKRRKLINLT